MEKQTKTKEEKECNHQFEILDEHIVYETSRFLFMRNKTYFSKMRTLKCKKCGILINHRTYLGENFKKWTP